LKLLEEEHDTKVKRTYDDIDVCLFIVMLFILLIRDRDRINFSA